MSVTNNSSLKNFLHLDDHTIRTTDTPGFKPFTIVFYDHLFINLAIKLSIFWLLERRGRQVAGEGEGG